MLCTLISGSLTGSTINKKLMAADFAPFCCEAIDDASPRLEIAGGIKIADG